MVVVECVYSFCFGILPYSFTNIKKILYTLPSLDVSASPNVRAPLTWKKMLFPSLGYCKWSGLDMLNEVRWYTMYMTLIPARFDLQMKMVILLAATFWWLLWSILSPSSHSLQWLLLVGVKQPIPPSLAVTVSSSSVSLDWCYTIPTGS